MATARAHPRGLYTLFFTEMWERFSYYGMRALLVLYLVDALDMPREAALQLYGTYTALVYLTPLIGGYAADRWLGARRSVLVSALLMACGHFAMAVPALLYLALGLLVAGNGFFKPNISSLVGALYGEGDERRDSGFTIFYMGINLGAFCSPLVCGTLGEKFGWHYGFAAAGVGMLAGLTVFARGLARLGEHMRLSRGDWVSAIGISVGILAMLTLGFMTWPRLSDGWSHFTVLQQLAAALLLSSAAIFVTRLLSARGKGRVVGITAVARPKPLTRIERHRVLALLIIAVFVVFFWMGFEQAGGTMNLFAEQQTNRLLFGWEMPASYFQSVNPLLILLLAPPLSWLWLRLDRTRFALSSVGKQGTGMIILGLGFVIMAIAQQHAETFGRVGPQWLLGVYFLHTVGELFLSPIGLSMVTKLAPAHLVSRLLGVWFVSIAIANYLAGSLEALLQATGLPLYWFLTATSIGAGALLLLIRPWLARLMQGVQ